MVSELELKDGSLITPMALAHPLHPIRNRSRNKQPVGWMMCFLLTAIGSGPYTQFINIHIPCIMVVIEKKLFLRDIYIPRVGVAMAVYWMM